MKRFGIIAISVILLLTGCSVAEDKPYIPMQAISEEVQSSLTWSEVNSEDAKLSYSVLDSDTLVDGTEYTLCLVSNSGERAWNVALHTGDNMTSDVVGINPGDVIVVPIYGIECSLPDITCAADMTAFTVNTAQHLELSGNVVQNNGPDAVFSVLYHTSSKYFIPELYKDITLKSGDSIVVDAPANVSEISLAYIKII